LNMPMNIFVTSNRECIEWVQVSITSCLMF